MHRPNRIGNHQLVDTSVAQLEIPILNANFGTPLAPARPTMAVQTDFATVQERHAVSFRKDDSETWALGATENFSFGRFIPGDLADLDIGRIINIAGTLAIVSNQVHQTVDMYIGRLISGSPSVDYTAQVNLVEARYKIPAQSRILDGDVQQVDVQTTIVNGLFNGGATDYSDQPLAVFWNVSNYGGSDYTLEDYRGSLSIFSWEEDIKTLDAVR